MTVNAETSIALTLLRSTGCVALCLALAGCPSASNPTQPPASTPPASSSSGSQSSASSGSQNPTASGSQSAPAAGSSPSMPSASSGEARGTASTAGAPDAGSQGASMEDGTGRPSSATGSAATDSEGGDAAGAGNGQVAGEPGFETGSGGEALPDMRDTPTLDPGTLAALEAAMEAAAASGNGAGNTSGEDSGTAPGGRSGQWPGDPATAGGAGTSTGPLTPAEQVAILDARLEAGTGEFDTMILEEQARQRSARRASSDDASADAAGADAANGATPGGREGPYGEEITVAGAGGGQGSVNTPGRSGPVNPARYPPPDDIPSGNDDDVVARQLREAAMREPDPAVREKLWEEYRKYKGITP